MATRDLVFHMTTVRLGKRRTPGMTADFRYTVNSATVAATIVAFTNYLRDARGWRIDSVDTI